MRVLVLDGNENQAVAAVRSLARAGHRVTVGASSSWSKAGWSRACSGTFTYPSPEIDPEAFVARIAAEAALERGTLVLPMTERTTLPLSGRRDLIAEAGGVMVLPPHATVLRAFDKRQTTCLAKSLGIRTPRTWFVDDPDQARDIADSILYPVVLKPRSSEEISAQGGVSPTGRPLYARNPREFVTAYDRLRQRCSEVLTQEFIEGKGVGYFALMRDGEPRAEFAHLRLRDVHPTGSGSSVRVSVQPTPKLREAGLAILRQLRWHGMAMVEFRLSADDVPVFLEVNGRFWTSLALAIHSGVDFPTLLARMAEYGDLEPPPPYRVGVRCRWMLGDFRHLAEVLRGAPRGYPGLFPSRMSTLLSFLVPVPGTFHDNFELGDPLPELADWLVFAFQQMPRALRKRRSEIRVGKHAQGRYSHP